jgi:DNA-binding transcriptional ArsR family regulator
VEDLSAIASLVGDPGRAAMLLKLMGGAALPAGELARAANVAPQTASGHLGRMVEGGLLCVECQGRHRYYSLANQQVGDAIEALLRLTRPAEDDAAHHRATAGTLAHARTCYSHLAGWLGVAITEAMERQRILAAGGKRYAVSTEGVQWFRTSLGIVVPLAATGRREIAGRCLDWTERRHHLSGLVGCALHKRLLELKWIAPIRGSRAIRVTVEGKMRLWDLLRLPLG